MTLLLHDHETIIGMATALRSLAADYLDSAEMRKAAYRLFSNASGEEMTRFDDFALTAERARRELFPERKSKQEKAA